MTEWCHIKKEEGEECVPCEVANAIAALVAIEQDNPGQLDVSPINQGLQDNLEDPQQWLGVFDKVAGSCQGEICQQVDTVRSYLKERICDQPGS